MIKIIIIFKRWSELFVTKFTFLLTEFAMRQVIWVITRHMANSVKRNANFKRNVPCALRYKGFFFLFSFDSFIIFRITGQTLVYLIFQKHFLLFITRVIEVYVFRFFFPVFIETRVFWKLKTITFFENFTTESFNLSFDIFLERTWGKPFQV